MQLPGVVGTAEGTREGRPCVLVLVAHRSSARESGIPAELEGVPVRIVESGTPGALGRR